MLNPTRSHLKSRVSNQFNLSKGPLLSHVFNPATDISNRINIRNMTEGKVSSPAAKQIQSESHPVVGKDGGVLPLPLPSVGGPPPPPP